ncbi:competence protein ComA, partial [Salmonella enterica subsp. enterica serovar Weltevreden]|nr:competence protein ComA [Salmonella enterica subsp. enterica serovar Weltevreden]
DCQEVFEKCLRFAHPELLFLLTKKS